tara:strand:- start:2127 stop:2252 length:126 start_codon:yes stop_codon:yes gene_type:complete
MAEDFINPEKIKADCLVLDIINSASDLNSSEVRIFFMSGLI